MASGRGKGFSYAAAADVYSGDPEVVEALLVPEVVRFTGTFAETMKEDPDTPLSVVIRIENEFDEDEFPPLPGSPTEYTTLLHHARTHSHPHSRRHNRHQIAEPVHPPSGLKFCMQTRLLLGLLAVVIVTMILAAISVATLAGDFNDRSIHLH